MCYTHSKMARETRSLSGRAGESAANRASQAHYSHSHGRRPRTQNLGPNHAQVRGQTIQSLHHQDVKEE